MKNLILGPFLVPYSPKTSNQNISKQAFTPLYHAKNQESSERPFFKKREKPYFGPF